MLQGKRELQARLNALGESGDMLRQVALGGVREAKLMVPRKTGNLGRTIRMGEVRVDSVSISAGGSSNVGYAAAVEFGTKAHTIVPRNARVLAWGGSRTLGGRLSAGSKPTTFAMRVNHPGSRAKPYLVPGLRKAAGKLGEIIVQVWNGAA